MASKLVVAFVLVTVAHAFPGDIAKRIPETEFVETTSALAAHADALKAIELLQAQGLDIAECHQTAEDLIEKVISDTNTSQTILDDLTNGEECASVYQQEVDDAKYAAQVAETAHKEAQTELESATTAMVKLETYSYKFLSQQIQRGECSWYTKTDENYIPANKRYETAVTKEIETKAAREETFRTLEWTKEEQQRLIHECRCKVQSEHEREWTAATSDDAANQAAWDQAHQMLCVLDGQFNATHKLTKCEYDPCPQNTKPYIDPAAETEVCQIAIGMKGECNMDFLTGSEYYALEKSTIHKGTLFCYHIKVGSEIEDGQITQDVDVEKGSEVCTAEDFGATGDTQIVGQRVSKISDTEQAYTDGTNEHCPGGKKRKGTLKVLQDPDATTPTVAVVEPEVCVYQVTLTTQHC
jgi:hypothetical protein